MLPSGLGGDVVLTHGEIFGERADAVLVGLGVDRVGRGEATDLQTGLYHDAGQVVTQHDRKGLGQ